MIETQFDGKIRVRRENVREYIDKNFQEYLTKNGIVSQWHAWIHLSNMALPREEIRTGLIIDAYRRSSKAILERCCSHSCHLINRILPMFLVLRVVFPCFHLQHWLQIFSLEYFGCTCLVHIHDKQRRKLDPRALKCMFIGYSTNKKGYKAIILWLENYLWPWMLLFMKQRHLFKPQTSGRESKRWRDSVAISKPSPSCWKFKPNSWISQNANWASNPKMLPETTKS